MIKNKCSTCYLLIKDLKTPTREDVLDLYYDDHPDCWLRKQLATFTNGLKHFLCICQEHTIPYQFMGAYSLQNDRLMINVNLGPEWSTINSLVQEAIDRMLASSSPAILIDINEYCKTLYQRKLKP